MRLTVADVILTAILVLLVVAALSDDVNFG